MRLFASLFLLAAAAAADEAREFEVTVPPDWDTRPGDQESVRAYFRTEYADSEPPAFAEVRVMAYAVSERLASKDLAAIAAEWAHEVESRLGEPRTVAEAKASLGGEEALSRDVRDGSARLTWHLARRGRFLYVFHVLRTHEAVEDGKLEEQIAAIRASFRFLKKADPDPVPPKPPPVKEDIPAALLARATMRIPHWRLECVKPEGLVAVPPEKLDEAERTSGVVAKFERARDQTTILVRIYARSRSSQRFTIEELAEQKRTFFESRYDEAHRTPPQTDGAWKPPLAEKAVALKLTGRGRTTETTRWYLAQCRNDRQYEIEIFVAGGGDAWADQVADLLRGFKPLRG